ncbi:hypothetical protein NDU88_006246 [Pleurodeles waltl]|uniref:Uncharacterized protein n=1 Tax=Pleurodeles waltl TaxID=8319 RepID=A0AAV7NQ71_PLEWA|nr:hypothetical protein NDU88_006246 [Pleurodeles waltl]
MEVDRGGPAAPARLWPPAEPVICIPAGQDPRLRPIRSRGGNGRSERSADQKRAQHPRQLPCRSARHRSRHAGQAPGGDGSRPRSGSRVFVQNWIGKKYNRSKMEAPDGQVDLEDFIEEREEVEGQEGDTTGNSQDGLDGKSVRGETAREMIDESNRGIVRESVVMKKEKCVN